MEAFKGEYDLNYMRSTSNFDMLLFTMVGKHSPKRFIFLHLVRELEATVGRLLDRTAFLVYYL